MPRILCLALLLITASASAEVKLAAIFSDHAVLQRDKPIPIWGTAAPAEAITITLVGQTVTTTADADGNWHATLKSLPAGGPYDLKVTGTNKVTVHDLLIGEVWLASGQSNMEFPLSGVLNSANEVAAADHPQLRVFVEAARPLLDPAPDVKGDWQISTPANAKHFTAVGYFFGLSLLNDLHVPIGIISASVGATPAETWTPLAPMQADPLFSSQAQKDTATLRTLLSAPLDPAAKIKPKDLSSSLYNGEIYPLRNYALRGAIWYQGEDNANHFDVYPLLMNHLITGWRQQFQQDIPFYLVQLVNYDGGRHGWDGLREAQSIIATKIPKTGLVVGIDVGQTDLIHPKNKRPIGERLALLARHRVYGEKIEDTGPTYSSMKVKDNKITIQLTHAEGLHATGSTIPCFVVADSDQKFVPATATIEGDVITVSSTGVSKPTAVRYAFAQDPEGCNVYNEANLPMAPFRSDTWPLPIPGHH